MCCALWQGYDVVFAFEEAIGFACGDLISDKDGVSAAGACHKG